MRFMARNTTRCLLFFPVPGGWEVRIAHDEGYETIYLNTEQAWQIAELIHDCEAARKDAPTASPPRGPGLSQESEAQSLGKETNGTSKT